MRSPLALLLFEDDEWLDPWKSGSVVVQVVSATPAKLQASTKRTLEKFPVQSFRPLVTNLSTIAKNRVPPKLAVFQLVSTRRRQLIYNRKPSICWGFR